MIKIVGFVLLFLFALYLLWIATKAYIEFCHINDKKLKKSGFDGSYKDYKRQMKKKKEIRKSKEKGDKEF